MKAEIPTLNRCCFCIPARYGLLLTAYVRLLIFGYVLFASYERISWLLVPDELDVPAEIYPLELTSTLLSVLYYVLNIGYSCMLVFAAHKKSVSLFKCFYRCEFAGIFINFVLIFSILIITNYIMWYYGMQIFHYVRIKASFFMILPDLLYLCVQLYVLSLTKYEIKKQSPIKSIAFVTTKDSQEFFANTEYFIGDYDSGHDSDQDSCRA